MVEFDIGMKSSDSSKICIMVLASFFIIMISYIWYKFNTMIRNMRKWNGIRNSWERNCQIVSLPIKYVIERILFICM